MIDPIVIVMMAYRAILIAVCAFVSVYGKVEFAVVLLIAGFIMGGSYTSHTKSSKGEDPDKQETPEENPKPQDDGTSQTPR